MTAGQAATFATSLTYTTKTAQVSFQASATGAPAVLSSVATVCVAIAFLAIALLGVLL